MVCSGLSRAPLSHALLLSLWLAFSGAALAHGDFAIHLARQTFCVAPASVALTFEGMDEARQAAAREALLRTLGAELRSVLAAAEVDVEERASCADADAFVLLVAGVRYLDPRSYIGFGEEAYSYDLSLRVGALEAGAAPEELQDLRFAASAGDIHSEGETGEAFEGALEAQAVPLIGSLAAAWWEDNPPGGWRALLPPLLGVMLSLLAVAAVLMIAKRQGRTPLKLFSRQR